MIVAMIALIVAVGGTAYAANTLNGHRLIRRTVPGSKLQLGTVTGMEVKESSLEKNSIRGASLRSHSVTDSQISRNTLENIAARTIPVTYVKTQSPIREGILDGATALCPASAPNVIGGGADLSDNQSSIVNSSFPVGTGWQVVVYASKPNLTVTVTAICTDASN
jgi:hypothetical protein